MGIKLPDQEYLKKRLRYNEEDHELYWRVVDLDDEEMFSNVSARKRFNTRYGGQKAGHIFRGSSGQLSMQVRIDGRSYYVHRVIYKIVHGVDANVIDHVDGDPLNNDINNLRDVDVMTNCKNMKKHCKNTSGYTGVSWSKSAKKWEAYIWHKCKKYNLGNFVNIEDAVAARKEKELYFKYHPNHGEDRDFTTTDKSNSVR